MQNMKSDIKRFLAKTGLLKKYYEQIALNSWNDIVGSEIASHCQPKNFQGKKMTVVCSGPMWIQELSMRKRQIIKSINERVGKNLITDVKFVTGTLPEINELDSQQQISQQISNIELDNVEQSWIEQTVDQVDDEDFQHRIEKLIEKDIKLKKLKIDEGYTECTNCGRLTMRQQLCQDCESEQERQKMRRVLKVLKEFPWFDYQKLLEQEMIDESITRKDYNRAKHLLYQQIRDKLFKAKQFYKYQQTDESYHHFKDLLNQYILLISEQHPREIDERTKKNAIGALGKDYLELAQNMFRKGG